MSDLDRYLTDDLVDKVADVIDVRRHDFRVDTDTWVPYCICGWSAEESHDVAAYDRHLAVEALKASAPLIAARAWDEGFAEGCRGRMWDSANPYERKDER